MTPPRVKLWLPKCAVWSCDYNFEPSLVFSHLLPNREKACCLHIWLLAEQSEILDKIKRNEGIQLKDRKGSDFYHGNLYAFVVRVKNSWCMVCLHCCWSTFELSLSCTPRRNNTKFWMSCIVSFVVVTVSSSILLEGYTV